MEAEAALSLFDLYWLQTLILRRNPPPPPPPPPTPANSSKPIPPSPSLPRHRRSQSDDLPSFPPIQIPNPNPNPNPTTIFPGKIRAENPHQVWRRPKGESKSLTDLEFEELKGFMDLGFTFDRAEAADPRLISILPGLQRRIDLPEKTSDVGAERAGPRAPYLSEAWDAAPYRLRNWRIPVAGEGVDLKDHLRLWAQAVGAAVR